MGSVYEARDLRDGRRVAIKVLHPALAENHELVQRFEREALAASHIGSTFIAEVLDLGDMPSGTRYMVMELLEGESLAARLRSQRALPELEMAIIVLQLLEGLKAVHAAGIVHRDLKPANVFLTTRTRADGMSEPFVKILDLGVCKFHAAPSESFARTLPGYLVGTPAYMSPEQVRLEPVDHRSDLYAVGVLLYRSVVGKPPFHGRSLEELLEQLKMPDRHMRAIPERIDPGFVAIIRKAMAVSPDDRYQSSAELQTALAAWLRRTPRG